VFAEPLGSLSRLSLRGEISRAISSARARVSIDSSDSQDLMGVSVTMFSATCGKGRYGIALKKLSDSTSFSKSTAICSRLARRGDRCGGYDGLERTNRVINRAAIVSATRTRVPGPLKGQWPMARAVVNGGTDAHSTIGAVLHLGGGSRGN